MMLVLANDPSTNNNKTTSNPGTYLAFAHCSQSQVNQRERMGWTKGSRKKQPHLLSFATISHWTVSAKTP